jgi:hypothetical protein
MERRKHRGQQPAYAKVKKATKKNNIDNYIKSNSNSIIKIKNNNSSNKYNIKSVQIVVNGMIHLQYAVR